MTSLRQKTIAEALGTFALVFAGTGAIVINDVTNVGITHVGIALTFGLIVLAMIYTIGEISGAHLNPAVTLGFWAAGRFPAGQILPYIASQLVGAFAASGVLRFLFPNHPNLGSTLPAGSQMQSFLLELILTFLLMFVILNVSTGAKELSLIDQSGAEIPVSGTLESGTFENTEMSALGVVLRGASVMARLAFADGLSGLTYW